MTKAEFNSLLNLIARATKEMERKGIQTKDAEKFRSQLLYNAKEIMNTDLGPNIDRITT